MFATRIRDVSMLYISEPFTTVLPTLTGVLIIRLEALPEALGVHDENHHISFRCRFARSRRRTYAGEVSRCRRTHRKPQFLSFVRIIAPIRYFGILHLYSCVDSRNPHMQPM
ncbi:hypothetical protein Hanom_Chr00s006036g01732081 [Helianthus anomalus]